MSPSNDLSEKFFNIPLSTYRNRDIPFTPFKYGLLISAISILFFRTTVTFPTATGKEPKLLRWFFGGLLAFLSYSNKSYELICAVEIFSYLVTFFLFTDYVPFFFSFARDENKTNVLRIILIAISAFLCALVCHLTATGILFQFLKSVTPASIANALMKIFPIAEVQASYDIVDEFVHEEGLLKDQVSSLFFITFHIQVGIGYLGIDFLKQEQHRRNELVRMDMNIINEEKSDEKSKPLSSVEVKKSTSGKEKVINRSLTFQRSAAPFIFFTAVPYMVKVISYGNLNAFAFSCMRDDIHRSVRLFKLFDHDNHLVALTEHSAKSPADFANYMDTVVDTTYQLFNRKLFSLPKVMLLPLVMTKQPKMIAQIFPIIFITDWLKGRAVSYMTNRIEDLEKDIQELNAVISKVESFDLKNSELLHRSGPGAMDFTKQKWLDLTVQVQMKKVVSALTSRTKGFFSFIQRNFVFSVLVDCALAQLMTSGKIVAADIFVFSRAIEDTVDMILMRSRSEAELARMMTQISNLKELSDVWKSAKKRNLLPCALRRDSAIDSTKPLVVIKNLSYSRGAAAVQIHSMELPAGIYALTGPNGSGKSTLFRIIMSCSTNDRPIDIPRSILLSEAIDQKAFETISSLGESGHNSLPVETNEMKYISDNSDETHPSTSVIMPSSHVVEISQTFYWPLYSKPIDWIYQQTTTQGITEKQRHERTRRVAELLHSLEFIQSIIVDENSAGINKENKHFVEHQSRNGDIVSSSPSGDTIVRIMEELEEDKEDWFNDLSGGQRSKVELVRKVFLIDECPDVLLIDETMAPLDPQSKSLVMVRLKSFCAGSVVIVIYHTDVGREKEKGDEVVHCVPSNDFFDGNIHVENKMMKLRPLC
mmetsp:Transcript_24381/g.57387  ORF Transcript_24381/g.57387 Transcript_24381/m.57387 type:complete len:877 (-) Transcript_24381:2265-4895(-)|eukprot:CAMPEP_0197195172 /NCGR_PEP_ID=MMETSP1423-20130617/30577_1 /TAXON_ID=476441 /ORGANISM="Pseudo-nitzschia heimii, Strain UNC1101" /LENGTH=876 /DNA_ID=CAMNT_0042648739 /DNA_START=81 /DNA_END=2711 /DNA_ORIENTATION=+